MKEFQKNKVDYFLNCLGPENGGTYFSTKINKFVLIATDTCPRSLEPSSNTGRFVMFSVITNIYNKNAKGPILMELYVHHGLHIEHI
jgi:hypothetical protein